jgi:hypothetical protein
MQIKQWLFYSFLMIILIITTVFSLLLWSDTYSNTHYKRIKFYSEPNKNVLKVHYILENKNKYDSFIFGSSRVGNINPLKIKNGNYYNMTYSEGIPKEHLVNIQLFLKEGVLIKNLLIGLDEFSYQVSFKKHQHQGLTKAYYKATGISLVNYYRELYFRFPLGEDRHHIVKKLKHSKKYFTMDISKQKKNYLIAMKHFDRKHFTTYAHIHNKIFDRPTYYNGNTLKETLKDIQKIKTICKDNNINCQFFINPIHHRTYEFTNHKLLKEFKRKLSNITSFYDFSIQSSLTHDNSYWHETSHYTLEVGDMIIDSIYNKKSLLNKNSIPFVFINYKELNAL